MPTRERETPAGNNLKRKPDSEVSSSSRPPDKKPVNAHDDDGGRRQRRSPARENRAAPPATAAGAGHGGNHSFAAVVDVGASGAPTEPDGGDGAGLAIKIGTEEVAAGARDTAQDPDGAVGKGDARSPAAALLGNGKGRNQLPKVYDKRSCTAASRRHEGAPPVDSGGRAGCERGGADGASTSGLRKSGSSSLARMNCRPPQCGRGCGMAVSAPCGGGGNRGRPPPSDEPDRAEARRVVLERLARYRDLRSKLKKKGERRPDLKAFQHMDEAGETPRTRYIGEVPGVEIGDEFFYRVDLMVAGLHQSPINGIDSMEFKGTKLAICVVSSKVYDDFMEGDDVLVYTGEGGDPKYGQEKRRSWMRNPADQRLAGRNLALRNSMMAGKPVRVVHGFPAGGGGGGRGRRGLRRESTRYVYDGLYRVERFWWETHGRGFRVLRFRLRRLPGQPKLALKEVRRLRRRLHPPRRDGGGGD